MSANDSKIYFWIKLKKDFFDNHRIKIIEGMPNGQAYILLYLKLMCESTSHEGKLRFSKEIPYTEQMLASLLNFNIDTVHTAFEIFSQLGMLVKLDDGTYLIPEVVDLIGKETGQTIRKRLAREETKKLQNSENDNNEGKSGVKLTLDIRDKSIEFRERESNVLTYITKEKNDSVCLSSSFSLTETEKLFNTFWELIPDYKKNITREQAFIEFSKIDLEKEYQYLMSLIANLINEHKERYIPNVKNLFEQKRYTAHDSIDLVSDYKIENVLHPITQEEIDDFLKEL